MTDFDRLAAAAKALNDDPELGRESRWDDDPERFIEPHWSDDHNFTSEQQYNDYKAGLIPYPGDKSQDFVFLGYEDGVAIYKDRDKMTGLDHMQRHDHLDREIGTRVALAMYRIKKEMKAK